MPKTIKILALDGGGIRGIIPACILQYIEMRVNKPIARCFDLIAGTSTGGILALGLTKPSETDPSAPAYSANSMLHFYLNNGPAIFHTEPLHDITNLVRPGLNPAALEQVLQGAFGTAELKDAVTKVLIPAYDLRGIEYPSGAFLGGQPVFFSDVKARNLPARNFLMWQVARATSAAPTYFPPFRISPLGVPDYWMETIDGGMVANNPAVCAWTESIKLHASDGNPPPQFLVVSIGTGELKLKYDASAAEEWGDIQWIKPIIDILMDAASTTVHHQMATAFLTEEISSAEKWSYFRLQPLLQPGDSDMANASVEQMEALRSVATSYIEEKMVVLDALCERL